jgi:hypothetical protein
MFVNVFFFLCVCVCGGGGGGGGGGWLSCNVFDLSEIR